MLNSTEHEIHMLTNVIMLTINIFGMINTTSGKLKAKVFIFQHLCFNEQLKFHAQLSWAYKMFYNLEA